MKSRMRTMEKVFAVGALLGTCAVIGACSSAGAQEGGSDAPPSAALREAGFESTSGQIRVVHVKLETSLENNIRIPTPNSGGGYTLEGLRGTYQRSDLELALRVIQDNGGTLMQRHGDESQGRIFHGFLLRTDGTRLFVRFDQTEEVVRFQDINETQLLSVYKDVDCPSPDDPQFYEEECVVEYDFAGDFYVTLTYAF